VIQVIMGREGGQSPSLRDAVVLERDLLHLPGPHRLPVSGLTGVVAYRVSMVVVRASQ
jgi:hypothetical protein